MSEGKEEVDITTAFLKPEDTALPEDGIVSRNAKIFSLSEETMTEQLMFGNKSITVEHKGQTESVQWLAGQHLGGYKMGPAPAKVMIINKTPSRDDEFNAQQLRSGAGTYLFRYLEERGITRKDCYATCILRFMLPSHITSLKAAWVKECNWFLARELEIVKPEIILMLGTEVVKALFSKPKNVMTLARLRGVETLHLNGIPAVASAHPAAVLIEPMRAAGFKKDMDLFARRYKKIQSSEPECNYHYIRDTKTLNAVADAVEQLDAKVIAVDCEWGSNNEGSDYLTAKLRTVQFSIAPYTAFVVHMRKAGMEWVFEGTHDDVVAGLKRIFCRQGVRFVAHSMRADIKFLIHELALDIDNAVIGGYDTMLMYHLTGPHEEYGLNHLIMLLTTMPRYDTDLENWMKNNGYSSKAALRKYGYGMIPDDILLPYSAADVDVLMRIYPQLESQLKNMPFRYYGKYEINGAKAETLFDLYRYVVQMAAVPLNDIEMEGFSVDQDRLSSLVSLFLSKYNEMVGKFRESIKWPEFNPRSVFHVRHFLFGPGYSGKEEIVPPDGAVILSMDPVKTTEKPSRDWDRLNDYEKKRAGPSTDSETLDILAAENELAAQLKNIRFIDQMIKNFLRPGEVDDETGEVLFDSGLLSVVDYDSKVRTNLSQLTDTGRYRSFNPNLQNLPNKQEVVLKQLFCPEDKLEEAKTVQGLWGKSEEELKQKGFLHPGYHTLRSCFIADYGYLLVEADYEQAELNVLAHLAQDKEMMAIMGDPSRDLHSEMAVTAFNLDCTPAEVKKIYPKQRVMAKNVNFGIAYGRGAAALVRQIRTEGIDIEKEKAQEIIDVFFEKFPGVRDYMQKMRACVTDPGFVETPYGRRRRFYPTKNKGTLASNERQAINMPIQGTVADCLTLAAINFWQYRKTLDNPDLFRVVLPVHDALFFQIAPVFLEKMTKEIIPLCMSTLCKVPVINLNLGVDITKPMIRWKVKADDSQIEKKFAEWDELVNRKQEGDTRYELS